MDRHILILLNRLSCASVIIATITLFFLLIQTPETSITNSNPTMKKFPRTSCESTHREIVSFEKKNKRIWSTNGWRNKLKSFTQFFREIQSHNFFSNHTKVLCVSAGAGHEVMALMDMGVTDVTGVELFDSPPLVSRADPHNLPFFDGVFDLSFSAHFDEALFPTRFIIEFERTVRRGGFCLLAVEECSHDDLMEIKGLFKRSRFVDAHNVTLTRSKMTRIIMRVTKSPEFVPQY